MRQLPVSINKRISVRLADKMRKKLHKVYEQFSLNLHVVNFRDVTFDSTTGNINLIGRPVTIRYTYAIKTI